MPETPCSSNTMPIAEAALTLLAGKAADLLLDMKRQAEIVKVRVNDDQLHLTLPEHLRRVARWADTIVLLSLPRERRLADSFVELSLTLGLARFGGASDGEPRSLREILDGGGNVALLGGPGAGKTTSLQKIAQYALQDREAAIGGVPLLVRLRDLRGDDGVVGHLLAELGVVVSGPAQFTLAERAKWKERVLIRILERLEAVLLIDGLDEVDPGQRRSVESEIAALAVSSTDYRLFLTCRTADYRVAFQNVQSLTIQPLSAPQVELFAERWLGKEHAGRFVDAVAAAPYAGTHVVPLMLAHLCVLYERDRELPRRPIDVYEQVVSLLVEEWDRERGVQRKSRYAALNWRGRERFLAAVAYQLTMLRRRGSFNEDDLRRAYAEVAPSFSLPADEVAVVMEEVESHTGLVLRSGYRQFDFIHLTIQEFLTAMHARGLADSVGPLFPSMPNELALVVASSPAPEEYLERVLCTLLENVGVLQGHPFVRTFLSRVGLERPVLTSSARLGWVLIGFEQLLTPDKSTSVPGAELNVSSFLPDVGVTESVRLAAFESEQDARGEQGKLIPKPAAHIPPCLLAAYRDRHVKWFAVTASAVDVAVRH